MFQNDCFALCQGSSACLGDTKHFNLKVQVYPTWTAFRRPKFDEKEQTGEKEQAGFKAPVTRLQTFAEKQ